MNFLLQMRERFLKYYETHDTLVRFLFRFAVLLISLSVVTYMIGFASILCMPLVIVAISFAGAFGKNYVQILIVSSVITIHLYACMLFPRNWERLCCVYLRLAIL